MLDIHDFVWALEEHNHPQPIDLTDPETKKHVMEVTAKYVTAHFDDITRFDAPDMFWDLSDLKDFLIDEGLTPKVAYFVQNVVDSVKQDFYLSLEGR